MDNGKAMYQDLEEIFYTADELKAAIAKLGKQITEDYQGKSPLMICILKGASLFFSDLVREIDLPLEMEFMSVASYGASTMSTGEVRLVKDVDCSLLGRDVIIVEDIVDTGKTVYFLKQLFAHRGAASMKVASLLDKPARRQVDLKVDYSCFEVPDAFVVGYGLDYNQKYRNLPEIGVLASRIYRT